MSEPISSHSEESQTVEPSRSGWMVVVAVLFVAFGVLSMWHLFQGSTPWDRGKILNAVFSSASLVVGLALWFRQNWARWLGIVWLAWMFATKVLWWHYRGELESGKRTMALLTCLICLMILWYLYQNPFRPRQHVEK